MTWLHLFISGLATFRLAVLLSEDDGPAAMFSRFRAFLKREAKEHKTLRATKVHEGIACPRCSSAWVSLPVAAYGYFRDRTPEWFMATGDVFLIWMALSALAILFNRVPKQK